MIYQLTTYGGVTEAAEAINQPDESMFLLFAELAMITVVIGLFIKFKK